MVQSYIPKFSYIIPFRYSPDRILPLRRIIEWLSGFQNVEIIVVEQDKHSKIDYLNIRAKHIFIQSEAPFNKSWALNVGVKRATSQTILFGDADFIMNPMELIEALKMLDTYDCVIPTDKVTILTQQQSAMDSASILQIKNFAPKNNMLDGISIFKKDAIQKIAGWNEDLLGVGYENQFNELKIKQNLNYKQLNFGGFHIFHFSDKLDQGLEQRNKQIFEYYRNDTNMLTQHINQTLPKIGMANRFAGFSS